MKQHKPWREITEKEIMRIRLKKCVKCKYSAGTDETTKRKRPFVAVCDYIGVTGRMRGTRPEDCTHWKE